MKKLAGSGFLLASSLGLSACSGAESLEEAADYGRATHALLPASLPDFAQAMEATPSVVRDDGVSVFHVRYAANRTVSSIRLTNIFIFTPAIDLNLYDDGTNGDEVAGDRIYTSRALTLVPGLAAQHFQFDPRAPVGLALYDLSAEVIELDGATSGFLVAPSLGVLATDIPLREVKNLGATFQATEHFFNQHSQDIDVQTPLRAWGGDLGVVTREFYRHFGDDYDFFMLWSLDKLEAKTPLSFENFVAGRYWNVQTDYTGSALIPWNQSAAYGSGGRLLGIAVIDQGHRGLYGNNLAHELTHQWAAFTSSSLGLQEDFAHWAPRTSVGSVVGGYEWLDNEDGTFTVNAEIGRGGLFEMAPLDRYFAGFIGPESVPPIRVARAGVPLQHGYVVQPDEIERTLTVEDIITVHGPRSPGPAMSRKEFRVAVGTVSHGRLLSAEEMTFYDILAEAAFRPLEPGEPLPRLDQGFPTLSGYFGPGTELRGELLARACVGCDFPLFGFERAGDWSSAVATNLDTTTFSQGSASLAVLAQNWSEVTSRAFATSEIPEVTDRLAIDLFIPTAQPNPYWVGDLHLLLQCPSVGLYQTWIGNQALTSLPRGVFSSVEFSLPERVTKALAGSAGDCSIKLALNVNRGSEAWRLDNLRFVR